MEGVGVRFPLGVGSIQWQTHREPRPHPRLTRYRIVPVPLCILDYFAASTIQPLPDRAPPPRLFRL